MDSNIFGNPEYLPHQNTILIYSRISGNADFFNSNTPIFFKKWFFSPLHTPSPYMFARGSLPLLHYTNVKFIVLPIPRNRVCQSNLLILNNSHHKMANTNSDAQKDRNMSVPKIVVYFIWTAYRCQYPRPCSHNKEIAPRPMPCILPGKTC